MTFNPTLTPFLLPTTNNPSYGTDSATQVIGDPDGSNTNVVWSGANGTLTIQTVGNLKSLAQYTPTGIMTSLGSSGFGSCAITGSGTINVVNGSGVAGNPTLSVIPSSSVQLFQIMVDDLQIGAARDTLNLLPGSGISIVGQDTGFVTNVTLASTGAEANASYVVTHSEPSLVNSFNLGGLGDGLLKQTVTSSNATPAIAVAGTDYVEPNANLTDFSNLTRSDGAFPVFTGMNWQSVGPGVDGQVLTTINSTTIGWTTTGEGSSWSLFPAQQNVDMADFQINNLAAPTADEDAANKKYVDDSVGGAPVGAYYLVSQTNAQLINEVNLGALPTGLVLSTVSGSVSTVSTLPTSDFVDITSDQTIDGEKTFLVPPVMSGASIATSTIPAASVVGTAMVLADVDQEVAGIITFDQAPVMSGASITVNTIPASSTVGTAMVLADVDQTVLGDITFAQAPSMSGADIASNTIPASSVVGTALVLANVNQTAAGIITFSQAPVMSGASITINTIPATSTVGTALVLADVDQTVQGIITFSQPPVMSGADIASSTIPSTSVVNVAATLNDSSLQTFQGDVTMDGDVILNGSLTIPTGAAAGSILTSDVNGVATWQTIDSDILSKDNTWSGVNTYDNDVIFNAGLQYTPGAIDGYFLTCDADGNASWAPDVGTNLLPLNNTWTGTNTFQNTVVAETTTITTTSISSKLIASGFTGSELVTKQASLQTNSNLSEPLITLPLPASSTVTLSGTITGASADHTFFTGGYFTVTASRPAVGDCIGSPTAIVNTSSSAEFDVVVDPSSQSVIIMVTGLPTIIYNWVATYNYQFVYSNS